MQIDRSAQSQNANLPRIETLHPDSNATLERFRQCVKQWFGMILIEEGMQMRHKLGVLTRVVKGGRISTRSRWRGWLMIERGKAIPSSHINALGKDRSSCIDQQQQPDFDIEPETRDIMITVSLCHSISNLNGIEWHKV
jgi:hypothetical protein